MILVIAVLRVQSSRGKLDWNFCISNKTSTFGVAGDLLYPGFEDIDESLVEGTVILDRRISEFLALPGDDPWWVRNVRSKTSNHRKV